jgi:hypothetical protein
VSKRFGSTVAQNHLASITWISLPDPRDAQFQTTFAELREGVEGHVGMEEDELMPDAEAVLGDELERLGRQMEERKKEFMAGKSEY